MPVSAGCLVRCVKGDEDSSERLGGNPSSGKWQIGRGAGGEDLCTRAAVVGGGAASATAVGGSVPVGP
jgi:hypothetical protein